ncbi:hypothetical protein MPSEU_000569900 [Mayamaea pseudoterrestris]|nr:hypothetical protein MPSEU_000569900 [Mayamaea pseudoterrestris]
MTSQSMWKEVSRRGATRAAVSSRFSQQRPQHLRGSFRNLASASRGNDKKRLHSNDYQQQNTSTFEKAATVIAKERAATSVMLNDTPAAASTFHPVKARVVLNQFMESLHEIQQHLHHQCKPLPPVWTDTTQDDHKACLESRNSARQKVKRVVQQLCDYTKTKPSVILNHSHELTTLLGRVLQLYAQSYTSDGLSYKDALRILQLMTDWNLDLQQSHCDHAMEIAARSGRWKEAGTIFWHYIDPDHAGYRPFNVSVTHPVGLYEVARAAQELNKEPVEAIMDAVLKMTMVSPCDQEKYIMAAGAALGLAGEWKALVHYLQASYSEGQMGQSLVAAAMSACLQCNRPEEAIRVFDDFVGSDLAIADEWQWRGGQVHRDPRCRKLAIQALSCLGGIGASEAAYKLFEQANECGDGVDMDTLIHIFKAFENQGRWKDAVFLFFNMLDTQQAELLSKDEADYHHTHLLPVLESVIRCCNGANQFGSAILAMRIHQLATSLPSHQDDQENGTVVHAFAESICLAPNRSSLLKAALMSLAGLGLFGEALKLLDVVIGQSAEAASDEIADFRKFLMQKLLTTRGNLYSLSPWNGLYREILCVTAGGHERKFAENTFRNPHLFSVALGNAIYACNLASQPEMGLMLIHWMRLPILGLAKNETLVKRLPDLNESFVVTDRFLASLMNAHTLIGSVHCANALYESNVKNGRFVLSDWLSSSTAEIHALFALDLQNEAMALFHKTLTDCRNPDLCSITARGLLEANLHQQVYDVFRLALTFNCLSEDLVVTSMQAVDAISGDQTNLQLQLMVNEVSQLNGVSAKTWLESHYWALKRLLKRSSLNFLMCWRSETWHLDELDYALTMLETSSFNGLTPNDEVLRLIIKRAQLFHPGYVSKDRTWIARVPRDREGWITLVDRVLQEAQNTELISNDNFISDVSRAYEALRCEKESDLLVRFAYIKDVSANTDTRMLVNPDSAGVGGATTGRSENIIIDDP